LNRIDSKFADLRAEGRLGLFPYLTMGYPTLDATEKLALAMLEAGADGLELGVPFSDPVADGVTLQRVSEKALHNGATLGWTLDLARRLREHSTAPLIAMTYFNPMHKYGIAKLASDAASAGIDGFIVPDLPSSEAGIVVKEAIANDLHVIQMVAPTTTDKRLEEVGRTAAGFVYCVSLLGTTGARTNLSDLIPDLVARSRAHTKTPLVIGFGISRPDHVAALKPYADACIVGGAVADLLESTPAESTESALRTYIASLRAAC
jgi:tryptophan synthase alpha chain